MTAEVVDFARVKADREPRLEGKARCLDCKHEWAAVAPIGTTWLDCPACSLCRGRFIGPCEREDPQWTCHCGNKLFYIVRAGTYCPNCGEWQVGF